MIFHEKSEKLSQNLSSAAVVIDAVRVSKDFVYQLNRESLISGATCTYIYVAVATCKADGGAGFAL